MERQQLAFGFLVILTDIAEKRIGVTVDIQFFHRHQSCSLRIWGQSGGAY